MRPKALCGLLAGVLSAISPAGGTIGAPVTPGWADTEAPQGASDRGPSLLEAKLAFFDALTMFRAEGLVSDGALRGAAETLAAAMGDDAAVRIASYYGALAPQERIAGFKAEERFDEIRGAIHELDARSAAGRADARDDRGALGQLERFIKGARQLRDEVPAAQALSLSARLAMRRLERSWPGGAEFSALEFQGEAQGVERAATFAIDVFGRAGMATPQLEPEWIMARLALIDGDLADAGRRFRRMNQIAQVAGQDPWRERALLGLVGVARERGSPTAASAALSELATVRSPKRCWGLAREVAVQRLARDDAAEAIHWLEAHPPNPGADDEIQASRAQDEWSALMVAAHLRARRPFEARQMLDTMAAAQGEDANAENGRRALPLRAALQLELGDPEGALLTLSGPAAEGLPAVDLHTLRGRAYLAAGRTPDAILELEAALAAAAQRDMRDRRALIDASAVGEWLGLSAVADLAKAYLVGRRDALGAAAAIEAAHAGITVDEAREQLLTLASGLDLGLIIWIVGADTTLMVHVEPSGRATHRSLPTGRAAFARAIRRVRQGILDTREAPMSERLRGQLRALAESLLPADLNAQLLAQMAEGNGGPSLVLMPHGTLERLPFEVLPLGEPGGPGHRLGTEVSLTIVTKMRPGTELAPRVDLRKARWTAIGAPTFRSLPGLDGAMKELSSLGRMNPRMTVLAGPNATREALVSALDLGLPLHVSSHAVPVRPGQSDSLGATCVRTVPYGLAMSGDDVVTSDELAAAAPRVPLFILAACASGDGSALDGASVRGLAQVALDAGTRCSLLTQWPISDQSAYHASLAFHGALLSGSSPAEGARRARKLLRDTGRPMAEWAAYRLSGAW